MFRSSLPVTAGGFHDRVEHLARLRALKERLLSDAPAWLAILGSRKIGKTSLLLEFERTVTERAVVFVVLDSYELGPPTMELFRRLALRLLDGIFSRELGVSLEALAPDPAALRAALQPSGAFASLPPTLRGRLLEVPDRAMSPEYIAELLQLPEQLARALDLHVIVAWDEFQALAALAGGRAGIDLFPMMRSAWQRQTRVAYLISGSERSMLAELVTAEGSPFFQHFSIMELGPFSEADAVELLVRGAPKDRPVPLDLARQAVAVIGSHPFYLQLLGEELTALDPPYDAAALKHVLQTLLFSRTGRLALYLEKTFFDLVGRSAYLAATMQALADGPLRLVDIATVIGAPSGSTARYVERLNDAVVRSDDGHYRLTDPTLGLWLRWRRPGGTVVPMTLVGDEAEQLVARALAGMGFDLVYQSRASRGAFDLLAIRGSAQLGVQVKRSPLPLRFSKSAWNRMRAEASRFGWRWIVAAVLPATQEVVLLDPGKARHGEEVRVHPSAVIENLLMWIDTGSGRHD